MRQITRPDYPKEKPAPGEPPAVFATMLSILVNDSENWNPVTDRVGDRYMIMPCELYHTPSRVTIDVSCMSHTKVKMPELGEFVYSDHAFHKIVSEILNNIRELKALRYLAQFEQHTVPENQRSVMLTGPT